VSSPSISSEQKAIKRTLIGFSRLLIGVVSITLACFHLYTAYFGVLSPLLQRFIHLFGLMLICFILYKIVPSKGKDKLNIFDWIVILIIIAIGIFFYLALDPEKVLDRGINGPSTTEIIAGLILILLILEGTRRSVGLPIVMVAVAFLVYGYFGPYMPKIIAHKGYDVERLVSYLIWTTEGAFGIPIAVSSTFVIIFILFGAFLDKLGAGDFFINLALSLSGRVKGGPAETAVISSAMMGSISGSSVSNVVTTGTFTIPLMIRTGYTPLFAGAVEAVASTGGQIMPPVMGAGAFVMAEMLGISYVKVAISAAIPALLYFASVGLMVYFEAERKNVAKMDLKKLPKIKKVLKEGFYLFIPLIVLIYLLVIRQLSPMKAGFFTIVSLLFIASVVLLIREKRFPWREIIAALENGVKTAVPVAMACASAGIVIGVVSLTGLGVRFTQMVIHVSGGRLWLGSLLTMIACLILGMGLPTTAAYIITAVLGAPALVSMGVPTIAAHMFIFYFAIISFITPPVAISAYAASGIAKTNAMKTGLMAFRLGLAGFIVPFLFIYSPSILLIGKGVKIVMDSFTALLGVVALAAAIEGWFFIELRLWLRVIFLFSAILLIVPHLTYSIIGIIPLVLVFILKRIKKRNKRITLDNRIKIP